jgi:hypothetical protein
MRKVSAHDGIARFWGWFSDHASELAGIDIHQLLLSELERRLFAICEFDWEIGPGQKVPHFFALSPAGDRKLLELTRAVIEKAPNLRDWEFYPAKPPRNWNLAFELIVRGEPVEIDGTTWECVKLRLENETCDLIFKPGKFSRLSQSYLNWAATIIVDGELGEEKRMELVRDIKVVKSWDDGAGRAATKLRPGLLKQMLVR